MQHAARLQGRFTHGSLLETISDILRFPQEGRLNVRNNTDGSWGNIYHRHQQIIEVHCKNLRSDDALERIVSWQGGDYLYYALQIPDELDKKPISSKLFQSLFGSHATVIEPVTFEAHAEFRTVLRSKLLEALGPIADYLIADTLEQTKLNLDELGTEGQARFWSTLLRVTPDAYHDRIQAVKKDLQAKS
jgi:hypothetical protein